MRKRWKRWFFFTVKVDFPVRNEHRQDECPKDKPSMPLRCDAVSVKWPGSKNRPCFEVN